MTLRHDNLGNKEIALIEEELRILEEVKRELVQAQGRQRLNVHKISDRLQLLREEATKAKEADLPALFDQMNTNRAIIEHRPMEHLPEMRSPYFARMRLAESGGVKDILLGHRTFLDGGVPVIDWRHAPVSRIFFNYRQGEEYEEALPGRVANGTLLLRHILTIADGQLIQIKSQDATYWQDAKGTWLKAAVGGFASGSFAGGAGSAARGSGALGGATGTPQAEISALLDPQQFALLDESENEPLLILGGAGCGKTTVALHRMAMLHYRREDFYRQKSMVAIVPEEGLARLTRKLLDSLGLEQVEAITFDRWIAGRVHHLIRGLPAKLCDSTPAEVIRYKRHPLLRHAFAALVARQADAIASEIEAKFPKREKAGAFLREATHIPLWQRIDEACVKHVALIDASRHRDKALRIRNIKKFYEEKRHKVLDIADDRMELFHNPVLIHAVLDASAGDFGPATAEVLIHHSRDQFAKPSRSRYHGIDKERLQTVDGKNLLDGDDDDIAGTIDVEDFAVLMELLHYKTGDDYQRFDRLPKYHHMVLDEAQELADIELTVIARALGEGASITICGDAAQQTDPSTSFHSWENQLLQLGFPGITPFHLTTNYRSTRQIADFAHAILGDAAPSERLKVLKEGRPVKVSVYPNEGCAALDMIEELTHLMTREPAASVAVIAREFLPALGLYDILKDVPGVRFVEDGAFEFKPGIDITDVAQVKGLEFDYVVIADASYGIYKNRPEDRRTLHVAATRAIHQLWVIAIGEKSIIVPP